MKQLDEKEKQSDIPVSTNELEEGKKNKLDDLLTKEQAITLQSNPTLTQVNNKESWYKNKLKVLIIIVSVILIIAIGVIIGVIASKKKKCKSCDCDPKLCEPEPIVNNDENNQNNGENNQNNGENNQNNGENNPNNDENNPKDGENNPKDSENNEDEEDNRIVVVIEHKKNEISIYNDVISKTSTVILETEENSGRRLEEKSTTITFNGKYLLSVYNVDNTIEPNVYYAYAVLLNLEKIINGNSNNLGGSDIRNYNNDFPFIKFSFDSNGKIVDKLYVPENYDKILTAYIYEFIEKVVPKLDKSIYGRRLQGESQLSYDIKDNKTYLNKEEKKEFEGFDGSENDRNIEVIVEGNQIKEVKTNSKSSFIPQNSFNVDKKSNFSEENADNTISTRTSPIKGFYETSIDIRII